MSSHEPPTLHVPNAANDNPPWLGTPRPITIPAFMHVDMDLGARANDNPFPVDRAHLRRCLLGIHDSAPTIAEQFPVHLDNGAKVEKFTVTCKHCGWDVDDDRTRGHVVPSVWRGRRAHLVLGGSPCRCGHVGAVAIRIVPDEHGGFAAVKAHAHLFALLRNGELDLEAGADDGRPSSRPSPMRRALRALARRLGFR